VRLTLSLLTAVIHLAAVFPRAASAQGASAFVPLDHPLLPLFEHLVARGELEDPSPLVRPFRQGNALKALSGADTVGHPRLAAQVRLLAEAFDTLPAEAGWELAPRAGVQAYTTPRRDLIRPTGSENLQPYIELHASARFGGIVAVTRPAIEPRLTHDPEWTGRRDLEISGRMVDAYVSGQWRWVRLLYGQVERNWGPAGVAGIPLSNAGYGRPEISLALGTDRVWLTAIASDLQATTDSSGQIFRRYFFAHRLDAKLSSRLRLGLWETVVVAGVDREFDGRFRNPVTLLLLANQYGLGDKENNLMIGLDGSWRIGRAVNLAAQLALDDVQYKNRSGPTRYPDRYAFTVDLSGPLARSASWRALYTQASSLAFRTFTPAQDFLDGGVGIGRTYDDYDQASLFASLPVGSHWLLTPEATMLRQGSGRIQDPVPLNHSMAAGNTPELFIGTAERTWRLALNASGSHGPVALTASAGFHHRVNVDNVAGRTTDRFVGRLFLTIGLRRRGTLQ
jgi:Capsule assembly protein Wzi